MGFFQDVGNAVSGAARAVGNAFTGGGGNRGGSSGGSNYDAAAAQREAEMRRLLEAQRAAAAAAAAAEAERIRQANIRAENERAQSAMDRSFSSARGQLGQQNTIQATADTSAMQKLNAANLAAGAGATGAGVSPNVNQSVAYGAAPSAAMPVAGNVQAAILAGSSNQQTGNTPSRSNKFTLPSAAGLTFGGA